MNALLRHVKDLSGVGGVLRPGIVHRLDRGTSGLLVVAKDDETHRALVRQFAGRTVEKEYLALVLGVPSRASGEIAAPIGRDPVHRKKMSTRAPRGREARSSWTIAERFDGAALLRVRIHTGRTHQIRVHLSSIGHPVAGDALYGGTRTPSSRKAAARQALASLVRPAVHAIVSPIPGTTRDATDTKIDVNGLEVTLPDGRRILPDAVLGPARPGVRLVHVGDAGRTDHLVEVCRAADTLVIESTYLDEEAQMATQFAHLTARRAAELAIKAGVKHLILTHLSRRYRERDVIAEARSVFPGTIVARDFVNYQVRRGELIKVELKEPDE